MRPFASSLVGWLLATLLAVAAVVALAMGWLALRPAPLGRSTLPAPTTSRPAELEIPIPAALLPLREGSRAVEASVRRAPPPRIAGAVLVKVTAQNGAPASGVVGVLEGETGAILRTARVEAEAGVLLTGVPAGTHWLCLADDERELRYSYRARTRIVVESGRDVSATLDGTTYGVDVLLGDDVDTTTVERSARATRGDDARWLCVARKVKLVKATPATTGTPALRARLEVRGLGAGEYAFHVRADGRPLAVALPGPVEIDAAR